MSNAAALKANYHDIYDSIDPKHFEGKLDGKVVLITGAGRGIGRATAVAFSRAGANVALLSRTKSQLEETAALCAEHGAKTLVLPADATDGNALNKAVQETENKLGPIAVLVNNAGANSLRPFKMFEFDNWWNVVDINLKAPMQLTHIVLPNMLKRNSGVIINVASRAGLMSRSMTTPYTTAKTALIRATACLQQEMTSAKTDISLFSLHPGGPKTEMNYSLIDNDVDAAMPGLKDAIMKFVDSQTDTVELCAYTCVFLATDPRAQYIKGRYIDVEQDIAAVCEAHEEIKENNLLDLKLEFPGNWEPDNNPPKR